MRQIIQPDAKPSPMMRSSINIDVELNAAADIESFAFDGVREGAEFRFASELTMMMMNLRTHAPKQLQPAHVARLASQPIQFKDAQTGQPIPLPELIRVHRFGDFCCALEVHGAAIDEQRYDFHLVVIVGEKLIGSPDPTVVIEPPPCTGPDCEEPPSA